MKTSNYRVVPLPTEVADAARRAAQAGAPDHAVRDGRLRRRAIPVGIACAGHNRANKSFCSLTRRFRPGRPYAESGPIFVHAQPCPRYESTEQYPADFRAGRVIRAYDREQNMIAGEIVNGRNRKRSLKSYSRIPKLNSFRSASADRGCYTFGIERA